MLIKFLLLAICNLIYGQSYCDEKYFLEGQIVVSGKQDTFLIERQENIRTSLESKDLNSDFFEFVQTLELFDDGEVIEVVHGKGQLSEFETQFCQLIFVSATLFKIHCQDGYNQQLVADQFYFKKEYEIEFTTELAETCEQFFIIKDQKFLVVCYSSTYFKFLTVDYQNNTEILIQHNQNLEKCKIKAGIVDQINYIAYYECQDWVLFYFTSQTSIKVVDKQSLEEDKVLIDIFQCNQQLVQETDLFLKFPNHYYILQLKQNKKFKIEYKLLFPVFSRFSCYPKLSLIYNEEYTNGFQIQEFITYQKFYIHNTNTKEIPIQGLLIQTKLLLVFSTYISIFHTESLQQEYQITVTSLRVLYQSNLVYTLDMDKKLVHIYRIKTENKIVISSNPNPTYLFEYYIPNLFNSSKIAINTIENPFYNTCIKVISIEKNSKEWIFLSAQNFTEDFFESESEITYHLQKSQFKTSEPYTLWLDNGTNIIPIMDSFNFENICQLDRLNQLYILDYIDIGQNDLLIAQDQHQLIFYTCGLNKIAKFKDIILSKEKKVLKYSFFLVAVSEDNHKLFLFQYVNEVRIIKQFTFSETVQSFFSIDQNFVCVTFLQFSNNFYIKAQYQEITSFFQKKHYQLEKPILFYFHLKNNLIIQDEEQIYIQTKENQIVVNLKNATIVRCQLSMNLLSINVVHNLENKLVTYFEHNGKLIQTSEFQLFGHTLIIPPIFRMSQSILVIAAKKGKEVFLLVYDCKEQEIFALKDVIQVSQTNFFVEKTNLIYYDINNQLIQKDLQKFNFQRQKTILCSKLHPTQSIRLYIWSVINPEKQSIIEQFELVTLLTCFELRFKIPVPVLELNQTKTLKLSLKDYLWGNIDDVKIKNSLCKAKLKGPIIIKQELFLTQYYGDQLFVQTSGFNEIFIIHKEKEITILLQYQKSKILFVKYQENQDTYIISMIDNSQMIVEYYRFNDKQYEFVKSLIFTEISEQNQLDTQYVAKIQGDIYIIFNSQSTYWFILFHKPVLLQQSRQSIHQLIQGSPNEYIFLYYNNGIANFDLKIEIFQLKIDDLELMRNISINRQYYEERKKLFPYTTLDEINEIKINYCKHENGTYISEILLIGNYQYSFLSIVQIFPQGHVNFNITKIIRIRQDRRGASVIYFEKYLLILKPAFFSQHFLYDLRTNDLIIDYISSIPNEFQIYSYNTTHQVIINGLTAFIGQLTFEIEVEEPEQENFTIELQAKNQLSVLDFNLTVIVKNEKQSNESLNIFWILGILLIIILFLIRRLILKEKNNKSI